MSGKLGVEQPTPTIKQMEGAARTSRARPVTDWSDPRLLPLIKGLHEYFGGDSFWGEKFDELADDLGIPARPKRDQFLIPFIGDIIIGGETIHIEFEIPVFGFNELDGVRVNPNFVDTVASEVALIARLGIVNLA